MSEVAYRDNCNIDTIAQHYSYAIKADLCGHFFSSLCCPVRSLYSIRLQLGVEVFGIYPYRSWSILLALAA